MKGGEEFKGGCTGLQCQNCRDIHKGKAWKVSFGSPVTLVIQLTFNKHILNAYYMPGTVLRTWDISVSNSILVRGDS